jgi:hypothetical protein
MWASRFFGDPSRPYGRVDLGGDDGTWLGAGWYGPEKVAEGTFRWAGARASLDLALDYAAPLHVTVRAMPYSYPGAPLQVMTIEINGVPRDSVTLAPEWTTTEIDVPADAWRRGVNGVVLVFSRATRPVDVTASQDARTLAAAIDWLRVAVIADGAIR